MSPSEFPSGLPGDLPERPPCPFCESGETELHSLFGSHASVTTYWCRSCRSPFEQMRWGRRFERSRPRDRGDGAGPAAGGEPPEAEPDP